VKTFIDAKFRGGAVVYCPKKLTDKGEIKALAHDADDDPRYFAAFTAAELVRLRYEDGPGDDVRSARWDSVTLGWEDVEHVHTGRGRGDREDFHVDG
jgi:hypothetical protein